MDNFCQGGKYSAQIAIHQAELKREETFTDQKYLSIISLQTDYLNIDSSSGSGGNNEKANIVQTQCTFCGGTKHYAEENFKKIRKDKEKSRTDGDSDRQQTERTPCKCFRCGYVDHLIPKFPKSPKYN